MAITMDVIQTCSNLEQRLNVLHGKTLQPKDYITELMIQVTLLTKICSQQQEEINNLKRSNPLV